MITGTWTGLEDAVRSAYALGQDIANVEVLEKAAVEAAKPLLEDIQRGAPRRPPAPDMADDFWATPSKLDREEGRAIVLVGPRNPRSSGSNGHGFIAPLIEFGTSKMRARPFIRPAYDGWNGGYPAAMAGAIRRHFERVVKKYTSQARKAGA